MSMCKTMTMMLAVGLTALFTSSAHATAVGGRSGYSYVPKGTIDIGLDNTFVLRQLKVEETGSLTGTYFGGVTPRYFILNNLSLGLSMNYFYQWDKKTMGEVESTSNDHGMLGFVTVDYTIRLNNGFFLRPGLGGGGFYGWRRIPLEGSTSQVSQSTLVGGAGRASLALLYYVGSNANLRAGIDFVARFGQDKIEGAEDGQSFSSLEAGFNIGFGYTL